jgi:hypothetical protein
MTPNRAVRDKQLSHFFRLLKLGCRAAVFNPWTQRDELNDSSLNGPSDRLERLCSHLSTRAARILIGEAAGYQGCHVSGIPFTSERVIMTGAIPRVSCHGQRLSLRTRPWSEPSATTVWKTLHGLGIETDTILWNAYPWHPHQPGNPHSNRTPSRVERVAGMPVLEALLRALAQIGRQAIPLRHPSMGGAVLFHQGLRRALNRSG